MNRFFRRLLNFVVFGILWVPHLAFSHDLLRYPRNNFAHTGERIAEFYSTYRKVMPQTLTVQVDDTFDFVDKQLLKQASEIFFERALKDEVIECALKKSYRGIPESISQFKMQLYETLGLRKFGDLYHPASLFIAKFQREGVVGLAYLNLFFDHENHLPGYVDKHYLHIGINDGYLGSSKWYGHDVQYWGGVIAHEILHNIGLTHGSGSTYENDYVGYFITEYGNCVEYNGLSYSINPADNQSSINNEKFDLVISNDINSCDL